MKINVTDEDIANGCQCNANYCPVALATLRAFQANKVVCGTTQIRINGMAYYLPDSVGRVIRTFDSTGQMVPFSFNLV